MAETPHPTLLNYVIRMVVPMRREFGRSLDVNQFMRDSHYAQDVLQVALSSQDQRLRDYATYVSQLLHGARDLKPAAQRPRTDAPAPAPPADAAVPDQPATPASEEDLRARMLRKYTTGLR